MLAMEEEKMKVCLVVKIVAENTIADDDVVDVVVVLDDDGDCDDYDGYAVDDVDVDGVDG